MKSKITFIAIYLMLFTCDRVFSQINFLDGGFGTDGIAASQYFSARAMSLQSDGKILVGGSIIADTQDPVIRRFNNDGSIDTTFGTNGTVQVTLQFTQYITDLVQLPNGKILAMGVQTISGISGSSSNIMFMQFSENGTLDTSIGNQGVLTRSFGSMKSLASKMILLPDGKVLVSGYGFMTSPQTGRPALARFNANLTTDTSFNSVGFVSPLNGSGSFNAMDVYADGRIVVSDAGFYEVKIYRYLSNGAPDTSFGSNGVATIPHGNIQYGTNDIKVADDGKIIIGGWVKDNIERNAAMFRALDNGSPDLEFGTSGFFKIENSIGIQAAIIQMFMIDDKIICGSQGYNNNGDFELLFRLANGSPDNNITDNGQIINPINGDQQVRSFLRQPDGKVVAMGNDGNNVLLVRYNISSFLAQPSFNKAELSVYPNPAHDIINISGLMDGTVVSVYNISGQKVIYSTVSSNGALDVRNLPIGIYYVETPFGREKIIKN